MELVMNWFCVAWEEPYSRGIITASAAAVALIVFSWILRLIFFIKRSRGCHSVTIESENGNIVISVDAITAAVRTILLTSGQIHVNRIRFSKSKGGYAMVIKCAYANHGNEPGMPELSAKLKPLLLEKLHTFFGLSGQLDIIFFVESYDDNDADFDDKSVVGTTFAALETPRV